MNVKLPVINLENLFDQDVFGQKVFRYYLGDKLFNKYRKDFISMGRNAALATPYSDLADKRGPRLHQYTVNGERIDRIEYHSSYPELKKLSYGAGLLSRKYQGDLMGVDKAQRHLVGFSLGFYFAQTETGLFCPICMTDAMGYVLEIHATQNPTAQKVLKSLASSDINEICEGAMFLSEKQGGSDVGANEVRAERKVDKWQLYGEKWFCSNADAKAILVLARIFENGQSTMGTRGLGLFLMTRDWPQENWKNWQVRRLKEKLGVRSMASAEIELCGAEASLIGGVDVGFKMMTDMVNMSRIYNSVASLGIARRSLLEAARFAAERSAFGKKIIQLPLYQISIGELQAEFLALQFMTFEAIRNMDLFESEKIKEAGQLLRILTPLCKALTGKFSVFATAEAMELIGGNAYIEEHIMPRLYRDAQVLPIWEGTTQIQSLDLLRVVQKEGLEAYRQRVEKALAGNHAPELQKKLLFLMQGLLRSIESFTQSSSDQQQMRSRLLLEKAGRVMALSLTYEAAADKNLQNVLLPALEILVGRDYFTAPLATSENNPKNLQELVASI
jgi:acyl-CoA dehydrogenase